MIDSLDDCVTLGVTLELRAWDSVRVALLVSDSLCVCDGDCERVSDCVDDRERLGVCENESLGDCEHVSDCVGVTLGLLDRDGVWVMVCD